MLNDVIKLGVGAICLIIIYRLLGKKELSEITPLDIVYAAGLGDLVTGSLYTPEVGVWDVVVSLAMWGAIIFVFDWLSMKFEWFSKLFKGTPDVIVSNGKFQRRAMKKNRLEEKDVMAMLRKEGVDDLKEVKKAILEINGELSVKKY